MPGPVVVNLAERGRQNLMDVSGGLRRLADLIDSGDIQADTAAIVLGLGEDPPEVHGLGGIVDRYRCAGLLSAGVSALIALAADRD